MESIYLFGISTTSCRVKAFIEFHKLFQIKGFIVDDAYKTFDQYEGHKVFSVSEFRQLSNYRELAVFLCLAWNRLNEDRRDVFERFDKEFNLVNLISPHSVIRGNVEGRNIWIGDYSVLELDSIVQSNCIMDHLCFVGTHTILESHNYIAVKAMIAGNTKIGEQSFIGINATIFDQIIIGKKCIIAGGETVKRNVNDFTVVKTVENEQVLIAYDESEIINKLVASKNIR